jgi:uncharacterized membrane protein
MGPGFVMIYIVKQAKTMNELRHAYAIRKRIHIFVMVGGTLLLLSGLGMGLLRNYLFYEGWYVTSLFLFLIALVLGPLLLSPRSKPIKKLLQENKMEEIPESYFTMARKLFFFERMENVIFLIIIVLMILKPF